MKTSRGKDPTNVISMTPKKIQSSKTNKEKLKDPVEVYCRVRPLNDDESATCVEVTSDTVLQIKPPECSLAYKAGHLNPTLHTFKKVFGPKCNQSVLFEHVGIPLVEDLLSGKNGLLFAYGITNSGKTYTMTGEPEEAGVLPRSLDVIFNSIADVQAPRYVFFPDGINGYDIFSEEEANIEQKRNKPKKISPRMRVDLPDYGDLLRIPEAQRLERLIDEDSGYAVFVSYVEIYNNYLYDLLEDMPVDPVMQRPLTSRILREDPSRNMFVSGCVEVEVKNTEEAFEVLCRGQKRRRVAHTQLNQESSRSHSVFTIRLVQAPLDLSGKEVLQDKHNVIVSQLSMVDLAGSERSSRTNTRGDRLKEASSINKALLVLRNCMETLRDNQIHSSSKIVPYRDTKLTHLFKNYFDGEGKVRMVVCVSPREEDYDESIHVMRFAEITQEVVVDRQQSKRIDTGLAVGRKRAYLLYKAALKESLTPGVEWETPGGEVPPPTHPYMLALGVLSIQKYLTDECSISSLREFKAALEERDKVRGELISDIKKKQSLFRTNLESKETELEGLQRSVVDLKHQIKLKDKTCSETKKLRDVIRLQDEKLVQLTAELEKATERRLKLEMNLIQTKRDLQHVSGERNCLLKTTELYEADKRGLEHELDEERRALRKRVEEKEHLRSQMQGFVSAEKEKIEKLTYKMKSKDQDLAMRNAQLRQVEKIIKNSPCLPASKYRNTLKDKSNSKSADEMSSMPSVATTTTSSAIPSRQALRSKPSNVVGRKRSFSENWLAHKPSNNVTSGDILQPALKKKRTVTTPKFKHFHTQSINKYCLEHQEEDSEGDIKTCLYKGAIMKTRGGGHAIQFTDVEVLKHSHSITNSSSPQVKPRPKSRQKQTLHLEEVGKTSSTRSRMQCSDPVGGTKGSKEGTTALSCSSSLCSVSGDEHSNDELGWTDVETRCAVAIEGRPGGAQPGLVHMSPSKK